ncbi:hypothetical protein RDWZM_002466 [Blomia tropicalis]|uniref:FAD-dependent oxidoreductase domain-containing protein 1 n=1 Tax=Blomia tropicalis TaxID=40697 RepID=A0A9Q0MDI4_BLOTA|nr:hypothetical protein RDWZM_002466 [Blomia tropicalis]
MNQLEQLSYQVPTRDRSRSQFGTRDSDRSRNLRTRSLSPTEFYRSQRERIDMIHNKVYEMNTFIYLGIEKFLDKQAVRNLIIEYDNDNIFVEGEEKFYSEIPFSFKFEPIDVAIFGGGIIGSSIAYFLKAQNPSGIQVKVYERDPTYRTASTPLSVGGIRQQWEHEENIAMSLFSSRFIQNAHKHLSVAHNHTPDLGFHNRGYLTLANQSVAEQTIRNHRKQLELGAQIELLTAKQIKQKFPYINTDGVECATFGLMNEGWLDPWSLLSAFKSKAQSLGVEYVEGEVVQFALRNDGQLDRCNEATIRQKGELNQIQFNNGILCFGWNSVDYHGEYCRPEGENFLCGRSPTENDDDNNDNGSDESINLEVDYSYFDQTVYPLLAERIPAFEAIKLKSSWAGYYDYCRLDQNPIIGHDPYYSNLIWAAGFSGHGIQMSPAVGRAVAELILDGRYRSIDLSRFGWHRVMNNAPLSHDNCV